MKIFSTFSGIGGFEIGIQNAWLRTQGEVQPTKTSTGNTEGQPKQLSEQRLQGLDVVGYSEIDKYAIKVYERNFNGNQESGESVPEWTRSREHIRPIGDKSDNQVQRTKTEQEEHLPKDSSRRIKNYGDITKINAEELPDFDCLVGGFPCQAFSIAGKRKGFEDTRGTLFFDLARILRAKQPRLFVFENVKGLLSHDGGRTFKTIIQTIDELGYDCQWQVLNSKDFGVPQNRERIIIVGHLRGTPRPEVFPISQNDRTDIVLPTLTARYYGGQANGGYISDKQTQVNKPDGSIGGQEQAKSNFNIVSGRTETTPRVRRLTPVECERLQAFPDDWTKYGTDGPISDSQRYKMCGNAVTTNVVQAVFERIFDAHH